MTKTKRIIIITIVINMLIVNSLITFATPLPTDFNKTSSYAREAVKYLFTNNIIKTQNNQAVILNPTAYINRVDMIRLVDYTLNIGPTTTFGDAESDRWIPFDDLKESWQKSFVGAAYRKQIIKGATRYRPYDNISREEVAAIFMRMMAYESNNEQLEQVEDYDKMSNFKDKNYISSWAKGAVEIMLETGIMNGVGDQSFNPRGNATKEQIMVMLYRYVLNKQQILEKYNKMVYEAPDDFNGYITLGMPVEQVKKLLGIYYDMGVYKIDSSGIYYEETDQGKVVSGWKNNGFLKVKTGRRNPSAPPIKPSYTKEDVIELLGTPNYYYENHNTSDTIYLTIRYGGPEVSFNRDLKVIGWEDEDHLNFKDIYDPQAPPLTYGSTLEDVFKTMGYPNRYLGTRMYYGYYSYLTLDSPGITGKVSQWYNYGELKMNMGKKILKLLL